MLAENEYINVSLDKKSVACQSLSGVNPKERLDIIKRTDRKRKPIAPAVLSGGELERLLSLMKLTERKCLFTLLVTKGNEPYLETVYSESEIGELIAFNQDKINRVLEKNPLENRRFRLMGRQLTGREGGTTFQLWKVE